MYYSGFDRETEPRREGERKEGKERERDSKELAHVIVRAGKLEICRAGWQPGNSGKI